MNDRPTPDAAPDHVKHKSASLIFRGFEDAPESVERLIGVPAKRSVVAGTLGANGRAYPRSVVTFTLEFREPVLLVDMLPRLFEHVGGVANILHARNVVQPEFLELDLYLPVKGSEEQESGFLTIETIKDVASLDATIAFGIY